jgi:hypothetical protein
MDDVGYLHDELHANVHDAIEAIEGELGVDPAGGQSTVVARLDRSELRAYLWPTAGFYYRGLSTPHATTATTVTANRLYYQPFYCPTTVTTAALAAHVGTGATGNVRVGLYAASHGAGGMTVGSLIVDAGTASTATLGIKDITVSQSMTANTWYYLACVLDAAISMRGPQPSGTDGAVQVIDSTEANVGHGLLYEAFTYGALPSSPGSLTRLGAGSPAYFVMVKL